MFQQPKVDFSKYSRYTESMHTLYEPASEPEHPGRYLKTLISADETKKSFAARLGVSKQTLFELLGERQRIEPAMAARLERVTSVAALDWLQRQAAFDAHELEKKKPPQ